MSVKDVDSLRTKLIYVCNVSPVCGSFVCAGTFSKTKKQTLSTCIVQTLEHNSILFHATLEGYGKPCLNMMTTGIEGHRFQETSAVSVYK
jgi:hypothetical protein